MTTLTAHTSEGYYAAYHEERQRVYPAIDAFEQQCGYAIDRRTLEEAARVLACPLKRNPPNWQHGRVLYAMTRRYLANLDPFLTRTIALTVLDIGTAKGFSALCLYWACKDAGEVVDVTSVDVLDPAARVSRNTVAEVEGLKTLAEILAPWPDATRITFLQSTGIDWLAKDSHRVHVAFIDGKHSGHVVQEEGTLLAQRQAPGDLVLFDDLQIDGVAYAVMSLAKWYDVEAIEVNKHRRYGFGVRRG